MKENIKTIKFLLDNNITKKKDRKYILIYIINIKKNNNLKKKPKKFLWIYIYNR